MIYRRTLIALGASLPFLPAFDVIAASASQAGLRVVNGTRLFIDAGVNGELVDALLDSGAELTLVDTKAAMRLGLTGGEQATARGSGAGTAKAQLIKDVTLSAAGLTLSGQTVAVMDLSDIGARLIGRPLDCVLGREIFDAARLAIDIKGGTLAVQSRDASPPGVRLPLTSERGNELLPIRIEGGSPVLATFDLGNGSEMMVGGAYAERAGLLTDGRPIGEKSGGGIGGAHMRKTVRLKSVEVAGRRFADVPAVIDPTPNAPAANIGVSLLRDFFITTDFAQRTVWLAAQ